MKYKLEFKFTEEGKLKVSSENDGFSSFELLGLLAWKQRDIEKQTFEGVRPDIISRKFIKD